MSTIVFTKFATTEAYRADPSIADEGMKLIGSLEGVVGSVLSSALLRFRVIDFAEITTASRSRTLPLVTAFKVR